VYLSISEVPQQPGIHSAEGQLTGFGLFSGFGNVFKNPVQFGCGEITVD
jgi:hypothetical protein